ncbi:hypothetical protein HMPREF1148_1829 [Selenomonas sp. FOBRC6]|nr:hypothetical protein HMPREF1148_1829 [Selenomonas sp. FOBRC6]
MAEPRQTDRYIHLGTGNAASEKRYVFKWAILLCHEKSHGLPKGQYVCHRDSFHIVSVLLQGETIRQYAAAVSRISSHAPCMARDALTRFPPIPQTTAPPSRNAAMLSVEIPPTAERGIWGSGPWSALKYGAPSRSAGKTFTMSAPAVHACSISVGVNAPGMVRRPHSFARRITAGVVLGARMNSAPAAAAASTASGVSTVPAPICSCISKRRRNSSMPCSASCVAAGSPGCRVTSTKRIPPESSASHVGGSSAEGILRMMATRRSVSSS